MRRKSERNKSKTSEKKVADTSTSRTTRRTSRRRKRSSSYSSSEESDDVPLKPAIKEVTRENQVTPPSDEQKVSESPNSDDDKQEQPIWKVKTSDAPSGEIQKLKICLQRPPTTPERTEKSPRRRKGKSDESNVTPDEKPQTQRRRTRRSSPISHFEEGSSLDNSIADAEKEECLIVVKETNEIMLGKGKLDCSQRTQQYETEECTQIQIEKSHSKDIAIKSEITEDNASDIAKNVDSNVDNNQLQSEAGETLEQNIVDNTTEIGINVMSQNLKNTDETCEEMLIESSNLTQDKTSIEDNNKINTEYIEEIKHEVHEHKDENATQNKDVENEPSKIKYEENTSEYNIVSEANVSVSTNFDKEEKSVVNKLEEESDNSSNLKEKLLESEENMAINSNTESLEKSIVESESMCSEESTDKFVEKIEVKEESFEKITVESELKEESLEKSITETDLKDESSGKCIAESELKDESLEKSPLEQEFKEESSNKSFTEPDSKDELPDKSIIEPEVKEESTDFNDEPEKYNDSAKPEEKSNDSVKIIDEKSVEIEMTNTERISTPSPVESSYDDVKLIRKRNWRMLNKSLFVEEITSKVFLNWYPSLKFLDHSEIKLNSTESKVKKEKNSTYLPASPQSKENKTENEVSNIGLNRKISIVNDEASKLQPPPSPSKNPQSSILYITNLVRPFTLRQLQELLSRTGNIVQNGFWTDKIKSKCYVEYESEEEATATRDALHGIQWPPGNGKKLIIDFGTIDEMNQAKEAANLADIKKATDTVPIEKVPEHVVEKAASEDKSRWEKQKPIVPIRDWDVSKVPHEQMEKDLERDNREHYEKRDRYSRSRERSLPRYKRIEKRKPSHYDSPSNGEDVPRKKQRENSSEAKLMDDLFRKTKTIPCVYWLPLSPEQIAQKQQERMVRMAEHKRRLEESRRLERERERDRDRDYRNRMRDRERERDMGRGVPRYRR